VALHRMSPFVIVVSGLRIRRGPSMHCGKNGGAQERACSWSKSITSVSLIGQLWQHNTHPRATS